MKRIVYLFLMSLAIVACNKDPYLENTVQLDIELKYAVQAYQGKLPMEGVKVMFYNLTSGQTRTFRESNGKISISDLAPGMYTVDASVSFDADDFKRLTGEESGADVSFNAQLANLQLNEDTQITLELFRGTQGQFVFKQIYYAGSDTKNGALFRDQFVEIHNNTDQVLYADGLFVARLEGNQREGKVRSDVYLQSNGQYDWSKSLNMPEGIDANRDYVYLCDLLQVPGSGTEYPVLPGKSIIIAQNALNHKVPYVNANGKEQAIGNPDLTVDLSTADFEAYFGDVPGVNPYPSDIDNPSVPNMKVYKVDGRDWLLDNPGRDAYVLFKAESDQAVKELPEYYAPMIKDIDPSKEKTFIQLPGSWIMDAVEAQHTVESKRVAKKLVANYDAGFTYVLSGSYSSEAVHRKVASEHNGVVKLKDTNNSTNDFVSQKAEPRIFVR